MNPEFVYDGPLPHPTLYDQEFWEGTKHNELRLLRCTGCGAVRVFGDPMCAECNAMETESFVASGRGTVWTWTSTYHPFSARWRGRVPYNLTVVLLDEGPRLLTMVVDCAPEQMHVGMPVEVAWEDATPDLSLPKFRPVREAAS